MIILVWIFWPKRGLLALISKFKKAIKSIGKANVAFGYSLCSHFCIQTSMAKGESLFLVLWGGPTPDEPDQAHIPFVDFWDFRFTVKLKGSLKRR